MQMSTDRHPSTISIELTVSLRSFGTGSGVLTVASCSSGDWGGSISAQSDKTATATDAGASESSVVSLIASMTDLTVGVTSVSATTASAMTGACDAPASSGCALRDAALRSSLGIAPVFSIPVPTPASRTRTQLVRTTVPQNPAIAVAN